MARQTDQVTRMREAAFLMESAKKPLTRKKENSLIQLLKLLKQSRMNWQRLKRPPAKPVSKSWSIF